MDTSYFDQFGLSQEAVEQIAQTWEISQRSFPKDGVYFLQEEYLADIIAQTGLRAAAVPTFMDNAAKIRNSEALSRLAWHCHWMLHIASNELKKKGAPYVLARVSRDAHAQFLLSCGADEVIYPEKQMAEWAAVRYSSDHIFDFNRLSEDHAIYETDIPESWIGHTITELSVRQKYRVNVLAVRQNDAVDPMPGPAYCFSAGDRVILLGSDDDVQRFLRFC